MKCVLDATAYSELVRGNTAVADAVTRAEAIFLPNGFMEAIRDHDLVSQLLATYKGISQDAQKL